MMRNRLTALVGAIALTTPLLPLALSPAYAVETADVAMPAAARGRPTMAVAKDPAGDVWVHTGATGGYQLFGALPSVDVRRGSVEHASRKVVVVMKFVDLSKGGYQQFMAQIRTKKMVRFVSVYVYPGKAKGKVFFQKKDETLLSTKGIDHRVDYGKDVVRLTVARKRLSNPAWVRGAMFNARWDTDARDPYYEDHPQHNQPLDRDEWLKSPPLSPKLYRG